MEPLNFQCRDEVGPVCGPEWVPEKVAAHDFHLSSSIPRHGVDVQEIKKAMWNHFHTALVVIITCQAQ